MMNWKYSLEKRMEICKGAGMPPKERARAKLLLERRRKYWDDYERWQKKTERAEELACRAAEDLGKLLSRYL